MNKIIEIGSFHIPIVSLKVNLGEYVGKNVVSKEFSEEYFYEVESIFNDIGSNCYLEVWDNGDKVFSEVWGEIGCDSVFLKQWGVLTRSDERVGLFFILKPLENEVNPFIFQNKPIREIRRYAPTKYDRHGYIDYIDKKGVVTSESNIEGKFHCGIWDACISELSCEWRFCYASNSYYNDGTGDYKYDRGYWNTSRLNPDGEYLKDFSEVYNMNDDCFFVGSMKQVVDLAAIYASNDMKYVVDNNSFFNIMKEINSGVVPDDYNKYIPHEFHIVSNDFQIPIVEKVGKNEYVFYRHNFQRYENEIKKELHLD